MQMQLHTRIRQDALGIDRSRVCADELNGFLKQERQNIEKKILDLTKEQGYIESHINVLELQLARPPARHVPLPAPVYNTRTKTLATLKAQSRLISYLLQTFTQAQIEMVSCGAIVTDGWYYDKDIEQHKGWLREKK